MVIASEPGLSETHIHEALSSDRRRMVIEYPQNSDLTLRELSEYITEAETGESSPLRNIRQSACISLQQIHVPKLTELDIVNYDEESKVISLAEADDMTAYMGVVPEGELSWSEYYAAPAVLGIASMIIVAVDVPVVSAAGASGLGSLVFAVLGGSAVYQRWTQEG